MATHLGMLGRGSPREHAVANQALAHILTDDDEHLANLVAGGGTRLSPTCFVRSHVDQQLSQKVYPTDQHIREFLGQWIHSLAAAA